MCLRLFESGLCHRGGLHPLTGNYPVSSSGPALCRRDPYHHDVERIAFLGLGTLGAAMAANLARAGFPVTAWNRTPDLAH